MKKMEFITECEDCPNYEYCSDECRPCLFVEVEGEYIMTEEGETENEV